MDLLALLPTAVFFSLLNYTWVREATIWVFVSYRVSVLASAALEQ